MKKTSTHRLLHSSRQRSFGQWLMPLSIALLSAVRSQAADITWTEAAVTNSLPTQWLQTNNWDALVVPTNTDNAIFGSAGTNALVTIQMATAKSLQTVGSITLSSSDSINRTIYNNSTATNGILALYGVGGTLLENSSSASTLFLEQSTTTKPIILGLAGSGQIAVDNASAEISIYSIISDYNGSHGFIKNGLGTLYLHGTNTYTGGTTNANGAIEVDAAGNFGSAASPLYLTGGNIICGADRSGGIPLGNSVYMSADTFIENTAGLTGTTRTLPFSGAWNGTGNTLTIANLTTVTAQSFILRLSGGFNFGENVSIGSVADTTGSFSVLQLYNPATNGLQTFTGTISSSSGVGYVLRGGSTASAGGTSIFTGNNTYPGGTIISYGTLLADNTTGSALGTGQVTVTNQGVLGGNGYVTATTHVGVENPGGTIAPGSLSTNIGNLNISDLTFGSGSSYIWKISSVTNSPGVNQDQITCSTQWTDAGNAANPISIVINSQGVVPLGWNSGSSYDWVIIQSGVANNFNASHFSINSSAFAGALAGGFNLYVDVSGSLHLTYTPGYNLVINVPTGSQTQGAAGYPVLTGATNIVKVGAGELILTNSLNSYSGLSTILGGTVSLATDALNGSGSLGANASITVLGNTFGNTNATLNIDVAGVNDQHGVLVQSGGTGTLTIGTTLNSGTANYEGSISLANNVTLNAAAGGTANFSGSISGSGGVTLSGPGTIELSGLGSYTGPTTAGNVSLDLNGPALGTNLFTINSGVTLDNTSGSSVTLNSAPQVWATGFAFTGSTNLNLGAGAVTITTNTTLSVNASTLTVGGSISGAGSLTKVGNGTLALLAATTNAYAGATTNAAGVINLNATATFGNGTGPLVLSGGNIQSVSTRAGSPIINPVMVMTNTRVYGNGTLLGTTEYRYLPFSGAFTVKSGAALYVDNLGSATNYFDVRLMSTNASATFTDITFPIVVGDPTFDTPGAFEQLDLANDYTTPTQYVNSVISGSGMVDRAQMPVGTLNSGGISVFNQQNTFSGGMLFDSGGIGFGTSSISAGGVITSGPVGTGTFTIGNLTGEAAYTLFAFGTAREVDNYVFLNGCSNIVVIGSYPLTFGGPVNMGGINKNWDIEGTGVMTLAGTVTNSATGTGGFSKSGPGTLVFSGNNLYAGVTTVRAGTLLVNNSTGSGTSTNTVSLLGGTLGGTGTIAGEVIATNGASLAPGASVGTLTLQNGADLSGGGALTWTLGANSTNGPGSNYSQLAVTGGNLVLGGSSVLNIAFTNSIAPNASVPFWQTAQVWRVATLSGGAAITGTNFLTVSNGVYSAGTFTASVDASGILVTFTPGSSSPSKSSIGSISLTGNQLTLTGANGTPGATYYVTATTNLLQSFPWTPVATNTFSSTGSFTNIITVNPAAPQMFYNIVQP